MMGKLFSADGIRGIINYPPLTTEGMRRLGRALGMWLNERFPSPLVLLCSDTRLSSLKLKDALIENLNRMGIGTVDGEVMPTASLSFTLINKGFFNIGIVVTASHNPVDENGIKIFDQYGAKIDYEAEQQIEQYYELPELVPALSHRARNVVETNYLKEYAEHLASEFEQFDWQRIRLVLDCANGATSVVAQTVMDILSIEPLMLNAWPDGTNINFTAGSEHIRRSPQIMQEQLEKTDRQIGVALDGDGDRVVLVDRQGNFYDGDTLLAILGTQLSRQNKLKNQTVVATQMSNSGLEEYLGFHHITLKKVLNGDKHITRALLANDLTLGGEQIGHIIIHNRDEWVTGDGLRTALYLLSALTKEPHGLLKDLVPGFRKWPQVLGSIALCERTSLSKEQIPGLSDQLECIQQRYPDVIVRDCRPASTESSYRLMLEARFTPVETLAELLIEAARPIHRHFSCCEDQVKAYDCVSGGELPLHR